MSGASIDEQKKRAFARQALADFQVYQILCAHAEIADCQRLHSIQMCLEKLSKAYYFDKRRRAQRPVAIESSHQFIEKTIPLIFMQRRSMPGSHPSAQLRKEGRDICRELDRLHPQVDPSNRPDNCEYPWLEQAGSRVIAPVDHSYPVFAALRSRPGVAILKCAHAELMELVN